MIRVSSSLINGLMVVIKWLKLRNIIRECYVCVMVYFFFGIIWYFLLFWCMVCMINECKIKVNIKVYVLRVILNYNIYFKKWLVIMDL